MAIYDFDKITERRDTNSLKYDFAAERGHSPDELPLWVADMDFPTAKPIIDAMHRAVEHGIFGYSESSESYYIAVSNWFKRHFGWQTRPEWLVKTPGVVFALATAVKAYTSAGDSVLIQPPVYYPFYDVISDNKRVIVENELLYRNGHYEIDFEDFEEKIKRNRVKLFILCSPHNPVCRVWTAAELRRLGEICEKYGVIVVSDEIHCDFTAAEHPHTVFANAYPELAERCVICTSPSKSFNLAGLQVANIWIADKEMRGKFLREIDRVGYSQLNCMGLIAAQAAYEHGEEWLNQCREYLRGNMAFVREFLYERLPEIKLVEPEGTYFAWLDCSGLGLDYRELDILITSKAKLWLDAGHIFGMNSAHFQRIVTACPRKILEQALIRLEDAIFSYCRDDAENSLKCG